MNPDVFVFAEQADWGSQGIELLAGLDAAFTKPFEFAARDALKWEYASALYGGIAAATAALNASPNPGTLLCTIGNHDVDRLATNIGDSFAKGKAAAAVLLTQPFPPISTTATRSACAAPRTPATAATRPTSPCASRSSGTRWPARR